jgi:hypothetical protein
VASQYGGSFIDDEEETLDEDDGAGRAFSGDGW